MNIIRKLSSLWVEEIAAMRTGARAKYTIIDAGNRHPLEKIACLFSRARYHGTTLESVETQLNRNAFDCRSNPRIYCDTWDTAAKYAILRAGDKGTPVILKVSSDQSLEVNDWANPKYEGSWGVGIYWYYRTDVNPVSIETHYKLVKEQPEPTSVDETSS